MSRTTRLGITAVAGLMTVGLLSACGQGTVAPVAAPAPVAAAPSTPVCSPAATKDSTGTPLPPEYADAATRIAEVACRHDYTALAALMDDPFTDDTYDSASPEKVVAGWRASDPSAQGLDALAAVLAQPPVLDQGGLTFTRNGATATFARMYRTHPWTGFVRGSSAGAAPASAPATSDPASCPDASTLTEAWNADPPAGDPAATGVRQVMCSGSWAGGLVSADSNAYSGLFRRQGSGWTRVDVGASCSGGEVPASLRVVCDSN